RKAPPLPKRSTGTEQAPFGMVASRRGRNRTARDVSRAGDFSGVGKSSICPIRMADGSREKTAEKILEILREANGAVSGPEIAARLGVSRAAVWKQVQVLAAH